jgi:serine/threonine protein kinase
LGTLDNAVSSKPPLELICCCFANYAVLLLQEYCDMGTLDSALSSWEGDEESDSRMLQRLLLLTDVASGLQVLHASSVVHGDLVRVKATNPVCCKLSAWRPGG